MNIKNFIKYTGLVLSTLLIISIIVSGIVYAINLRNDIDQNIKDIVTLEDLAIKQQQSIVNTDISLAVISNSITNIEKMVDDMHRYIFDEQKYIKK